MKMRYVFFILFAVPMIGSILSQEVILGNVIGLGVLGYILYFTNKIESKYKSDGYLTGSEKVSVIITAILNPIIAQSFYYYCWKNKFPKRAGQANIYGWIVFGVQIAIIIAVLVALWPSLTSIKSP
jgi:hypothetical protein